METFEGNPAGMCPKVCTKGGSGIAARENEEFNI
jgi:hypothetical protein